MSTENEQMMKKIMETEMLGFAYFYPSNDGPREEYLIATTAENMANFIGSHFWDAREMVITDVFDRLIVNTFGGFLDRCPNQKLCMELQKYLIPIQQGEKEAGEILMVTRDGAAEFYENEEQKQSMLESGMM